MAYLQTAGQTILLVYLALDRINSGLFVVILVHVHHPIEESPEQDVGEETPDKTPGEEQSPWFKEFVPPPSGLENEQQGEEKRREEIKNKAIQSSQPQDASCCSGQGRYGGAAVVQHSGVAPHSYFTDELRSLTFGYNSCHLGSGRLSQVGAAEMNAGTRRLLTARSQKHNLQE